MRAHTHTRTHTHRHTHITMIVRQDHERDDADVNKVLCKLR